MKTKKADPCEGCIWCKRIDERKVFCPFPQCVRERRKEEGARQGDGQGKESGHR